MRLAALRLNSRFSLKHRVFFLLQYSFYYISQFAKNLLPSFALTMTPTTKCLFSVLCIARCGPKLGVGEKKKKKKVKQVSLSWQLEKRGSARWGQRSHWSRAEAVRTGATSGMNRMLLGASR
jgi:hypothetical protein